MRNGNETSPLDYEAPHSGRAAPSRNGLVALLLSGASIVCYFSAFILDTVFHRTSEIVLNVIGISSLLCLMLSFVFASFAWLDGGRNRKLGLWAIGISVGWSVVIAIVVVSRA